MTAAGVDPQVLLQQAAAHESAGRLAEAISSYQRLLQQRPALPNSWYNLARLERRAGRYEAALASYRQALDRGVSQPEEVHLNRGVIYADDLRRDGDAERELLAALALNPNYGPALLNLANLHEDRGRRNEALAVYQRLLALEPGHHEALARYASLRGAEGPGDPLIARLRLAIDRPDTPVEHRASLGFALGKLLDACQLHDEAFTACVAANGHSRAAARSAGPLYDRVQHEQLIDRLIAAFPLAGHIAVAPPSTPPIFICGMFRSGSTLVEQVLAAHPLVRAGGEIPFLPAVVQTRLTPYPASLARVPAAEFAAIAQQYQDTLALLRQGAVHVTDKRPDNHLHIGLIKTLLPNAKIVHTLRDPLDNGLSIFFLHLAHSQGYALDLGDIGHHYREYRRLMAHWKSLYGEDILDFDYDAFVREPRPMTERLLSFCGLDWNEACMAFDRVDNSVRTASVWQVRQPLYRHASGRWRPYARHLGPLREMLGSLAGPET